MNIDDVAQHILSFLTPREILRICRTSRQYNAICNNQSFWKQLFFHKFPTVSYTGSNWKDAFIKQTVLGYVFTNNSDICFMTDKTASYLLYLYGILPNDKMDIVFSYLGEAAVIVDLKHIDEILNINNIKAELPSLDPEIKKIIENTSFDDNLDITYPKLKIWRSPFISEQTEYDDIDVVYLVILYQHRYYNEDISDLREIEDLENYLYKRLCKQ